MKGKILCPAGCQNSLSRITEAKEILENPRPAGSWRPFKCIFGERKKAAHSGLKSPPRSLYVRKSPDRGSLRQSWSKFLPRCQNPQFCGFAPRGKLVGECLPQTLLVVLADYISFTSAPARKFIHSVARPLPTQPASLGLRGGPMSAANERRFTDHAKEIQHTPPQPRCENPAVRR